MDSWGGTGQVLSQVPVVYGQTVRLAVHIQFLGGPDRIDLYVNPPPGATPSSADENKTDVDLGPTLQLITPAPILLVSSLSDVIFDDIRFGTTYADVVPAPVLGDFNLDGRISSADIQAIIGALTDLKGFQRAEALSDASLLLLGDLNSEGVLNNSDLQSLLILGKAIGGYAVVP